MDGGLQLSDDKRVALDANILVRKAGLLSRLTSLLTVHNATKFPVNEKIIK